MRLVAKDVGWEVTDTDWHWTIGTNENVQTCSNTLKMEPEIFLDPSATIQLAYTPWGTSLKQGWHSRISEFNHSDSSTVQCSDLITKVPSLAPPHRPPTTLPTQFSALISEHTCGAPIDRATNAWWIIQNVYLWRPHYCVSGILSGVGARGGEQDGWRSLFFIVHYKRTQSRGVFHLSII